MRCRSIETVPLALAFWVTVTSAIPAALLAGEHPRSGAVSRHRLQLDRGLVPHTSPYDALSDHVLETFPPARSVWLPRFLSLTSALDDLGEAQAADRQWMLRAVQLSFVAMVFETATVDSALARELGLNVLPRLTPRDVLDILDIDDVFEENES